VTRFELGPDGVDLTFSETEAGILRDLAGQLDGLLEGGPPDHGAEAVRDRLFPRAYLDPTADTEEREFQSVVHDDLVAAKHAAATALIEALDSARPERKARLTVSLDRPAIEIWVGALNDIRLALGVTLEVTDDAEDPDTLPPGDPRAAGFELYHWLTYLQGTLVEALLAGPDPFATT
jgi:hypothetical protein